MAWTLSLTTLSLCLRPHLLGPCVPSGLGMMDAKYQPGTNCIFTPGTKLLILNSQVIIYQ